LRLLPPRIPGWLRFPLSSENGTYEAIKARFWRVLAGKSPWNLDVVPSLRRSGHWNLAVNEGDHVVQKLLVLLVRVLPVRTTRTVIGHIQDQQGQILAWAVR